MSNSFLITYANRDDSSAEALGTTLTGETRPMRNVTNLTLLPGSGHRKPYNSRTCEPLVNKLKG